MRKHSAKYTNRKVFLVNITENPQHVTDPLRLYLSWSSYNLLSSEHQHIIHYQSLRIHLHLHDSYVQSIYHPSIIALYKSYK